MDEIKSALDLLYEEEPKEAYEQREAKRRSEFFSVLGIEDDGRRCPVMTKDEYAEFEKNKPERSDLTYKDLKGKKSVEIYFKFEPYHDVSYSYYPDFDCVIESRLYIGD